MIATVSLIATVFLIEIGSATVFLIGTVFLIEIGTGTGPGQSFMSATRATS